MPGGLSETGIVFIGPVGAGKSTQCKLVAQALGKKSLSLDSVADKYYKENGFSLSEFQAMKKTGFFQAYNQWWPSLAYAARKVVKDYPDYVIDFGAGHSHYQDSQLFESVKDALSLCLYVILLLPSSNLDYSVSVLRERSMKQRGRDWIYGDYDFIAHWVKDACNQSLATITIYTDGKSPEETRDEIITKIS